MTKEKKSSATTVSKKAKTPTQQAKVEANRIAYEARNKKIAEDRKKAAELRREYGYKGTDYQVLQQCANDQRASLLAAVQQKKLQLEHEAEERRRVYVEESMDGPSGKALKRWLAAIPVKNKDGKIVSKGRPATYALVKEFFDFYKLPRVTNK